MARENISFSDYLSEKNRPHGYPYLMEWERGSLIHANLACKIGKSWVGVNVGKDSLSSLDNVVWYRKKDLKRFLKFLL